jgi:hypothetical protein
MLPSDNSVLILGESPETLSLANNDLNNHIKL